MTHWRAFCRRVQIFRWCGQGFHRREHVNVCSSSTAALQAGALPPALGVAQVLLPLDFPRQDYATPAALSPGSSPRVRRL